MIWRSSPPGVERFLADTSRASTGCCGPAIEGSCRTGRTDSTLCVSSCAEFDDNEAITPFSPVCNAI